MYSDIRFGFSTTQRAYILNCGLRLNWDLVSKLFEQTWKYLKCGGTKVYSQYHGSIDSKVGYIVMY